MIIKAQEYIEHNFAEKISIQQLSERFTVGRRNFDRRFIKATGNTPLNIYNVSKSNLQKRTGNLWKNSERSHV
ncbi:hypothetical protein KUH03_42460 [Sphingobacterium sp. E70]|uniref:hypothetical protein n=1 Tax=Sphingobacterium sp. E70 TaxID=2853439 RepID=UPI00211BF378|nr:hypothetical protein [Sphingobacterium sp. E70]ULT25373.1 hypothetical protein KUH03_42460 [Sphingobacterium sp. E70]